MCSNPLTKDGLTFACRKCNQCIAARKADWVSRAMAERSTSKHTLLFALTYSDETEFTRDGAAMFRYSDIRQLLNRLRQHIYRSTGERSAIRFLCAGEQGSVHGRCHWHIVIYSDIDLTTVGEYLRPSGRCQSREDIISGAGISGKKKRLNWSMWPHGFTVVQEPNYGGMAYALSYALKDQFNTQNSKGTMREHKAEAFATGLFRQSKAPPIGWDYCQALLARLRASFSVLPSLQVQIPDQKYYWYPRGVMRRILLEGLRDINDHVIAETGRSAPQWSTLLARSSDNEKDLELLLHGEEIQEQEESDLLLVTKQAKFQRDERERATIRRRCGALAPCTACLHGFSDEYLNSIGIEYSQEESPTLRYTGDKDSSRLQSDQSCPTLQGVNPHCTLRDTKRIKNIFPQSAR